MGTLKTSAKPKPTTRKAPVQSPAAQTVVAAKQTGRPPARQRVLTPADQFKLAVLQIAKRYGVEMTQFPDPSKNPYKMSPQDALEVAQKAGLSRRGSKHSKSGVR